MDIKAPSTPSAVINYADRQLRVGSADYRSFAYPSDRAGLWNPANVADDGLDLSLYPGSIRLRAIVVCVIGFTCTVVMLLSAKGASMHGSTELSEFRISAALLFFIVIFIVPTAFRARKRARIPWIVVDRENKMISMRRAGRSIPFSNVVRLQVVRFAPVGLSLNRLSYRGRRNNGEMQIVFTDNSREQTWCIVAWPDDSVLKQFVTAFRQTTDIPVSMVNRLPDGNWQVEAFEN